MTFREMKDYVEKTYCTSEIYQLAYNEFLVRDEFGAVFLLVETVKEIKRIPIFTDWIILA